MADGLNRVMLLGNLGADPDLKMTPGGQAVCNLRLATSETYLDRNGQRQEKTEWHTVTVWGKRAEALAKIIRKGSRIFVEGGLSTRSYEKNGEKRYATDVQARSVLLCDKAPAGAGASNKQKAGDAGDESSPDLPYDPSTGEVPDFP